MRLDGIYQMLRRRGEESGIHNLHPHRFRHTFASDWLASDGSETDLMRLTGWCSGTMLQRYGASAGAKRGSGANLVLGVGAGDGALRSRRHSLDGWVGL